MDSNRISKLQDSPSSSQNLFNESRLENCALNKRNGLSSFEEIASQLRPEIQKIKSLSGSINDAVEDLRRDVDDKDPEEWSEIQRLREKLKVAKDSYFNLFQKNQESKQAYEEFSQKIAANLDECFLSYEYLTDGWGRFEEYEWSPTEEEKEFREHFTDLIQIANKMDAILEKSEDKSLEITCRECRKKLEPVFRKIIDSENYKWKEKEEAIREMGRNVRQLKKQLKDLFLSSLKNLENKEREDELERDFLAELYIFKSWTRDFRKKQKAILDFSKKLAQKEIMTSLDEYEEDPEKFVEKFKDAYDNLKSFLFNLKEISQIEDEDLFSLEEEMSKCFEEMLELTQTLLDSIENSQGGFAELGYDERDSNVEFCDQSLENMKEQISELQENVEAVKELCKKELENLYEWDRCYKEKEDSSKPYLNALSELSKTLSNWSLRSLKRFSNSSSLPGSVQQKVDLIPLYPLKERLELSESGNDLEKLEPKKRQTEDEIVEIWQKKNDFKLLEKFVDWMRLDARIQEIIEKRKALAKPFVSYLQHRSFGNENHHLFFSRSFNDKANFPVIEAQSKWEHPLKSPLVYLSCWISTKQIPHKDRKEFLFLYLSNREITKFEKGILGFLCGDANKKTSYKRRVLQKSIYTSLLISSPSQTQGLSPQLLSEDYFYPEYYEKFRILEINNPTSEEPVSEVFPHANKLYIMLAMTLAYCFQDKKLRKSVGIPSGNPVACVITSKTGKILSWAVNTIGESDRDEARHAEVNALQIYFRNNPAIKTLPLGSRIFTSLKPCAMCAGAICDSLDDTNEVSVVYGQKDPSYEKTMLEELKDSNRSGGFSIFQAHEIEGSHENVFEKIDKHYKDHKSEPIENAALSLNLIEVAEEVKKISTLFSKKIQQDIHCPLINNINLFLQNINLYEGICALYQTSENRTFNGAFRSCS